GATRVPGTPQYVLGLMQIRGRVVPLLDLRARFGLPSADRSLDSRVIVVRSGERVVGLVADSAREVIHISPEDFRTPPEVIAEQGAGFVRSVAQAGKRLVMLIEVEKVIGAITDKEQVHGEQRI